MSNFEITPRTGENFFTYTKLSLQNADRAEEWALANFVKYKGKFLNINQIANLTPNAYMQLVAKIFTLNVKNVMTFDDETIVFFSNEFDELTVKKLSINRNTISRIQAQLEDTSNPGKIVVSLQNSILSMFDITTEKLLNSRYEIAALLVGEVNKFFEELTKPTDSIDITNAWATDAGSNDSGRIPDLVSSSNKNGKPVTETTTTDSELLSKVSE